MAGGLKGSVSGSTGLELMAVLLNEFDAAPVRIDDDRATAPCTVARRRRHRAAGRLRDRRRVIERGDPEAEPHAIGVALALGNISSNTAPTRPAKCTGPEPCRSRVNSTPRAR